MAVTGRETQPRFIVDGPLTIEIGPEVESCLVRLVGELDLSNVAVLESELGRLLASDLQTVVVDLADLEFIDSIGLGCLLTATRRSRADGDRLRMLGATGDVDRVLKLTGLDQTLPLIDK